MTFQEWVDENGGQVGVARQYEFNASLVGSWYRYERFPRADNLNLLIAYSEGKINVQQWAAEFAGHQRKRNHNGVGVRQKRIKGNLAVNNLPRLKALFSELDIPAERCNLRGPRYLARWKHSNVTVLEVRNAISHLKETGKDAGDMDLIHKAISGARRAAIGRLEE